MKSFAIMVVIAGFIMTCQILSEDKLQTGATTNPTTMDIAAIQDSYKKMEEYLVAKIKDEKLWKQQDKDAIINKYIQIIANLKISSAVPILAKHIDYNPYYGIPESPIRPLEIEYPACNALCAIGIIAVPEILQLMKNKSPEEYENSGIKAADTSNIPSSDMIPHINHVLFIFCIKNIYKKGGYENEIAKLRLELEIKASSGKEKENLEKYLKLFNEMLPAKDGRK